MYFIYTVFPLLTIRQQVNSKLRLKKKEDQRYSIHVLSTVSIKSALKSKFIDVSFLLLSISTCSKSCSTCTKCMYQSLSVEIRFFFLYQLNHFTWWFTYIILFLDMNIISFCEYQYIRTVRRIDSHWLLVSAQ